MQDHFSQKRSKPVHRVQLPPNGGTGSTELTVPADLCAPCFKFFSRQAAKALPDVADDLAFRSTLIDTTEAGSEFPHSVLQSLWNNSVFGRLLEEDLDATSQKGLRTMRKYQTAVVVWIVVGFSAVPVVAESENGTFPTPPDGYDVRREGIDHGKLETIEYDSTTVGVKRKARIYTPPGYTTDEKYPVLYLLHGIGGDENEWARQGSPDVILDNIYADKKAVPMIVVLPNGRAARDVTARDPIPRQSPAFAAFEKDLLNDLIPFVEKTYPVKTNPESRALAGLSMGGGQSLNFGLKHLETFAWVGGFSSAPNTRPPAELIQDSEDMIKKLRLLYVSCGDQDGLFRISQGVHKMLTEKKVPHQYNVIPGGRHDFKVWKSDLYHFSQLLFREPMAAGEGENPIR